MCCSSLRKCGTQHTNTNTNTMLLRAIARAAQPALALSARTLATRANRNRRVVLVTGGAKGIGFGITESFLFNGDDVVCVDWDQEGLDYIKSDYIKDLDPKHGTLILRHADMSSYPMVMDVVQDVLKDLGRIDVLVNNCGIQPPESCVPIHELKEELWHKLIAVNLTSSFYTCKAIIPTMIKQHEEKVRAGKLPPKNGGGVIINIASVQGLQSQPGVPAYAASKGGMLALTRQLAMEYGKYGIRALAINPGTINTPLVDRLLTMGGSDMAKAGAVYPLQNRVGTIDEIGNVAVFLASDGASFMTGEAVNVDGGIMAKGGWAT